MGVGGVNLEKKLVFLRTRGNSNIDIQSSLITSIGFWRVEKLKGFRNGRKWESFKKISYIQNCG